jgi:cytochrome c-type biogenesis protein CcmH
MMRLAALLVIAWVGIAAAVQPDERLANPVLEQRAREISAELRCLVCQNQSIDDSNAPLARDLRLLVRQRLTAGDTDDEVRDYLVDRYGDFVLLKPPFEASTLILWLTPLLALLAGGLAVLAKGRRAQPTEALSEDEETRLARILAGEDARTEVR